MIRYSIVVTLFLLSIRSVFGQESPVTEPSPAIETGHDTAPRRNPCVIVTTDINNGSGDPDDRQSLCHLLWHADILDIRAIIPDRFRDSAVDACNIAFDLYEKDYNTDGHSFAARGFPTATHFRENVLVPKKGDAIRRVIAVAERERDRPVWVLAWGNLHFIADVLETSPGIADRLRLISIGTFRHSAKDEGDGKRSNWNGGGRQKIYDQFPKLWWLELDWTYNGMFPGQEPIDLKNRLAIEGGELGKHIRDVIESVSWADNFRAGDTPTVLYMVDPDHDLDDPTQQSWAGGFVRPFPKTRPYYWTGVSAGHAWDFADPSKTWHNADKVYQARVNTLLNQRPSMYAALIERVRSLYGTTSNDAAQTIRSSLPSFDGTKPLLIPASSGEVRRSSQPTTEKSAADHFVQLTGKSSLAWRFQFNQETGRFPIAIRYRSDADLKATLFLNSANLGKARFPSTNGTWRDYRTELQLQLGPNSIVMELDRNAIQLESLTIGN